ncbi:MAG: hypothetical protein K2J63_04250 [Muribaculaceae bacterium]|nr:hypothetical protein [Muribaculaceae bacterium]MDE6794498.1 hypothetical protein [Muribaculaceae bacterium]
MENEIIKELQDDEVVRFIANRHGIGPEDLVMEFLSDQSKSTCTLLDNEVEILHGLKKKIEQKIAI